MKFLIPIYFILFVFILHLITRALYGLSLRHHFQYRGRLVLRRSFHRLPLLPLGNPAQTFFMQSAAAMIHDAFSDV